MASSVRFSKEQKDNAKERQESLIKFTINKGYLPKETTPANFKNMKEISLEGAFRPELLEKAVDFFHYLLGDNKKPDWMK